MYAAIHPDGLVIVSQANLLNTRRSRTNVTTAGNNNETSDSTSRRLADGSPRRGPVGVTLVPVDPWWVQLAEAGKYPTRPPAHGGDRDADDAGHALPVDDWLRRVRVKVANEMPAKDLLIPNRTNIDRETTKQQQERGQHPPLIQSITSSPTPHVALKSVTTTPIASFVTPRRHAATRRPIKYIPVEEDESSDANYNYKSYDVPIIRASPHHRAPPTSPTLVPN